MGHGCNPEQELMLSDISRYFEDAKGIPLDTTRRDRDKRNFYAVSMVLFALSNRLIDLGKEVVYSRGYAGPEEELKNKVIFKRLADHHVIDSSLKLELIRLVDFRNRCSHHYHEVTKEDLIRLIGSFPRYEVFVDLMREELFRTNQIPLQRIALVAGIVLLIVLAFLIFIIL
jgi:uncharacterized protein YutE (UPF0331/DUF86 family)